MRFSLAVLLSLSLALPAFAGDKLPILSRQDWGAKPAIAERMVKQSPLQIVIHHSGIARKEKLGLDRKLRNLQHFSQAEKKWGDVPYHFYIDAGGRIGEGRDIAYAGDTNTRYDVKDKIQVVVEGDFEKETPAQAQLEALRELVASLRAEHRIAGAQVSSHGDHAQTDCPGKNLQPYLAELKK
jgi:hypothetical protein